MNIDTTKIENVKVVTLCGSSRFKSKIIEVGEKLALSGVAVLSLSLFGHADNKFGSVITPSIKESLDYAHMKKIMMSDSIFVINVGGYIGESTKREIEFAKLLGKPIEYLEPVD